MVCLLSLRRLVGMLVLAGVLWWGAVCRTVDAAEPTCHIARLQAAAIEQGRADFGHWGVDPENYMDWGSHSNRLIPVYTFGTKQAPQGVSLSHYTGTHSVYRNADGIRALYGRLPSATHNPKAEYCDQTNIYDLQLAGLLAGKKQIFLVIFDGMDWQTTQLAAIVKTGRIPYTSGRGTGLHFQDYTAGGTTEFGWMVTSPHNEGTKTDVNTQTVLNPGGAVFGGYDPASGGSTPWAIAPDFGYPITKPAENGQKHAYTDSSCSASSMTAGLKSYNNAVNVDYAGNQVQTIAHQAQERGYAVGAVTSVPISHATPAAAYAHNVHRDDYQDLTRDMLGLKSISHPEQPLPGMDVIISGGYGDESEKHTGNGDNFVPGNVYLTSADLHAVDVRHGGKYVTAVRTAGIPGGKALQAAAEQAASQQKRLLGFYGNGAYKGHLPFQTANGDFQPVVGRSKKAEVYEPADLEENPTLAEMTQAAITALAPRKNFWLMVEPGDVDWANHDNNIDNSAGAVFSGDAAVKVITDWVETHSNWDDALLIVTADHGHYLNLTRPELLVKKP